METSNEPVGSVLVDAAWLDAHLHDPAAVVPESVWLPLVARARPAPANAIAAERAQMAGFAEARRHWFRGRQAELDSLRREREPTARPASEGEVDQAVD